MNGASPIEREVCRPDARLPSNPLTLNLLARACSPSRYCASDPAIRCHCGGSKTLRVAVALFHTRRPTMVMLH